MRKIKKFWANEIMDLPKNDRRRNRKITRLFTRLINDIFVN